jgi:hypothetical protein
MFQIREAAPIASGDAAPPSHILLEGQGCCDDCLSQKFSDSFATVEKLLVQLHSFLCSNIAFAGQHGFAIYAAAELGLNFAVLCSRSN